MTHRNASRPRARASALRSLLRGLPCLGLAAVPLGCSGIEVETQSAEDVDLSRFATYAWNPEPNRFAPEVLGEEDLALRTAIQQRVDAGLARRGYRKTGLFEAQMILDSAVSIDLRQSTRDPYFSTYAVEQYEEGKIALVVLDKETRRALWNGSATRNLRVLARGVGLQRVQLVPTEETRDWRLDEMVEKILARIPERETPAN